MIKLTFHGAGAPGAANCTGRSADAPGGAGKGCVGETEFEVPANVAVVAQLPGDPSMLKPGAKVSVGVPMAPRREFQSRNSCEFERVAGRNSPEASLRIVAVPPRSLISVG